MKEESTADGGGKGCCGMDLEEEGKDERWR